MTGTERDAPVTMRILHVEGGSRGNRYGPGHHALSVSRNGSIKLHGGPRLMGGEFGTLSKQVCAEPDAMMGPIFGQANTGARVAGFCAQSGDQER